MATWTKGLAAVLTLGTVMAGCANPVVNQDARWGTIQRVAGTGTAGYAGDGGAGASAQFSCPSSLAYDKAGNLFVSDWANHVIRRVDPQGRVSTVAGTGSPGYSGDGGAARDAQLANPDGLATDRLGNLYVCDWGNNVVRRIDEAGTITTIAGNGTVSSTADGVAARQVSLKEPHGLAVTTSGDILIADTGHHVIRCLDHATGQIRVIAGQFGRAGYSGDGGPALAASFDAPSSLALDRAENLWVVDYHNNVIREILPSGVMTKVGGGVSGFAGDGQDAINAQLNYPGQITFDPHGNLFIADTLNHRVRRVALGTIGTVAGTGHPGATGDGGPADQACLNAPLGLASDRAGNITIADSDNDTIRQIRLQTGSGPASDSAPTPPGGDQTQPSESRSAR